MIRWKMHELLKDGKHWVSDVVSEGEMRHAAQAVIGGYVGGNPRAAIEEGTGRVVYAVDAKGMATADAVKLFSTVELAGK